jgi:hypothetical protein
MATLQRSLCPRTKAQTRKVPNQTQTRSTAVSADRVKEMLREIAFVLHATRVVARRPQTSSNCRGAATANV